MKNMDEDLLIKAYRHMNAREKKIAVGFFSQYLPVATPKVAAPKSPVLRLIIGGSIQQSVDTSSASCRSEDSDLPGLVGSTIQRN